MTIKKSGFQKLVVSTAVAAAGLVGPICFADNPVVQTCFTADPGPDGA